MKVFLKILVGLVALVVVIIIGGIIYINNSFPDVGPAPDLDVGDSPELIARGEYLANHVTVCMDCHSTRDWDKETFIMMFKELGNVEELVEVNRNSFNTIMPWAMYAGMTEEDLGAIFIYNRLNLLKMILKYLFEIIINTILPLLGGERGVGK